MYKICKYKYKRLTENQINNTCFANSFINDKQDRFQTNIRTNEFSQNRVTKSEKMEKKEKRGGVEN